MKIRQVFGVCLMTIAVCLAWGGKAQAAPIPEDELTIAEGVYAEGLALEGMTEAQAQKAVEEYVEQISQKILTVDVYGNTAQITLEELGISWTNDKVIKEAALLGRGGNVIARYKELEGLKYNKAVFDLKLEPDAEKLEQFLTEQVEAFNVEPKDASLSRKNGQFVLTESRTGILVDREQTKQALLAAIQNPWEGEVTAKAVAETAEPAHTSEELRDVKDRLGIGITYIANMANEPRLINVTLAGKKVNGTILYPGEEASLNEIFGPRNGENGWAMAGEYTETGSQDAYGGGICQAATTLYQALLDAEVKVTERWPHSRKIWYAEPSMDAAIYGSYKDLKFRNDSDCPIYIESYVTGNQVTYAIYGKETRPSNRRVEYVSKVISEDDPGYIEEYKSDLPTGTIEEVRMAYPKLVSTLTKKVYVDGKLVETIHVHKDTYKPLQGIRYIGTGPAIDGGGEGNGGTADPGSGGGTEGGSPSGGSGAEGGGGSSGEDPGAGASDPGAGASGPGETP